ncbi:MAG: L-threonine 3-dehydrogenase [Anaerolineae bacterium]|nr:L-threonine 3-dehydrogenase [Anaerolineae bacterium]
MSEKMRAIIKPGQTPGFEMTLVDIPHPGPRDVLIQIKAMSICGTDLHIYAWDPWARERIRPPIIVGHEFCGTVVERGADVTEVEVGAYVSAESHITCGQCRQCRTGRRHLCQNTQIIGVDRDGCFAEYVVLPVENIWVNPPDMPLEIASLQENFGNAVHTAFAAEVATKNVLITGCGPVGLMAISVVKASGARTIFATDISSYRLDLARKMGADYALNVAEVDVVDFIMSHTNGEGVDVLMEMSGAAAAIDQGFRALADGGEVAMLGLPSAPIPFDLANHVIFKGATIHGIVGRRVWDTWYRIRSLLSSGAVDLSPIITHRYPMEQFEEAIQVMRSGQSGKIVLFPDAVPD